MIKAIIIDDEALARDVVKAYLSGYPQITLVAECQDGFEGLKAIQEHQPDLIFLDIQMPRISGFELLELLENPPGVIFTTAFEEFAIRAFEASAVDYLLKPFSRERFDRAMQKWTDLPGAEGTASVKKLLEYPDAHGQPVNRVVVKTAGRIRIIPVTDIHYMEAADDYVKIFTPDGHFLKNRTMQQFEQSLDPAQFVRVHRSYIVNISQVTRIDPYEKENHLAILRDGARVPVSKSGYGRLKEVLGL
ncbi:MAG TPA: LytTR family transcriptional regulator DNA-binding domain-containing protein [Chitinophagaceae bacterium]|nr:LytTR family transcriptional regulator DNA-binding domain-containing protein [Chitinophagaceae bacterium]